MSAIVFSGPTLPPSTAPFIPGMEWRPPVRQGDLYKAALCRPALIGVIDGTFELVPTVWHKEILWAMTHGIHVYGAASIGALRAAELCDFGMRGIGDVFRQFHTGVLQDDDEVAVLHGPEQIDYAQVTEAMVNIRATLNHAVHCGIIEPAVAAELVRIGKSLFYKDRTYEAIFTRAAQQSHPHDVLTRFWNWLPSGQIDQKRLDALEMLQTMREHLMHGVSPLQVSYQFAHTFFWENARQRTEAGL
jgi:hypothetical protein